MAVSPTFCPATSQRSRSRSPMRCVPANRPTRCRQTLPVAARSCAASLLRQRFFCFKTAVTHLFLLNPVGEINVVSQSLPNAKKESCQRCASGRFFFRRRLLSSICQLHFACKKHILCLLCFLRPAVVEERAGVWVCGACRCAACVAQCVAGRRAERRPPQVKRFAGLPAGFMKIKTCSRSSSC